MSHHITCCMCQSTALSCDPCIAGNERSIDRTTVGWARSRRWVIAERCCALDVGGSRLQGRDVLLRHRLESRGHYRTARHGKIPAITWNTPNGVDKLGVIAKSRGVLFVKRDDQGQLGTFFVQFSFSPTRFGGWRAWFRCPGCRQACRVLYGTNSLRFRCVRLSLALPVGASRATGNRLSVLTQHIERHDMKGRDTIQSTNHTSRNQPASPSAAKTTAPQSI